MNNLGNTNFTAGEFVLPKSDKELTNTMASYYALQVALQTMKERCQQLQQRLSVVEEENLRLQIEKQNPPSNTEAKGEVSGLQEQVAQLTRQKSQLTHHIFMVATENKQLWTRLSRLTEANQSLGSYLTKTSDTFSKNSLGESSRPNQSFQIMNSCKKNVNLESNDEKDASLEEISLKIISSIIKEKMELEKQCDQSGVSVENCEFALSTGGGVTEAQDNSELEEMGQDLRRILDNLREERDQLTRQQAGLRATLASLTYMVKNGMPCKKCKSKDRPHSEAKTVTSQNTEEVNHIVTVREPPLDPEDNRVMQGEEVEYFEDRICPLCSQFFHRSIKFEDFHSHVLTHFAEEDAEVDSLVTNNFQIVN